MLDRQSVDGCPRPPTPDPFAAFAADLNERLAAECVGIDEAANLTRTLADNTVVEFDEAVEISTVEDPMAECTRAIVNVTGAVYVTLRGPKG